MLRPFLTFVLAAAAPLSADVTLRYKTDFKMNPSLPAAITEQTMKNRPPLDSVIRVKGRKGVTDMLGLQTIIDMDKQVVTIIDPGGKRYATTSADEYKHAAARAIPAVPPQAAQMMSSMKAHTESKLTGRTAEIHGVQSDERELIISVDAPDGAPITGPMMKMVMQIWMAKPAEGERVSAIREVAALNLWNFSAMDPGATVQKMLEQMPGVGEGLKSLIDEMAKNHTVMMRTHVDLFMPMLAALARQMPAGGTNPLGEGFDANTPFFQMNQEVAELSTGAVPDSAFQVPADYKSAPIDDILKDMMSKLQGAGEPHDHQ